MQLILKLVVLLFSFFSRALAMMQGFSSYAQTRGQALGDERTCNLLVIYF
mgnify:CR=1 FL=1